MNRQQQLTLAHKTTQRTIAIMIDHDCMGTLIYQDIMGLVLKRMNSRPCTQVKPTRKQAAKARAIVPQEQTMTPTGINHPSHRFYRHIPDVAPASLAIEMDSVRITRMSYGYSLSAKMAGDNKATMTNINHGEIARCGGLINAFRARFIAAGKADRRNEQHTAHVIGVAVKMAQAGIIGNVAK